MIFGGWEGACIEVGLGGGGMHHVVISVKLFGGGLFG